MKKTLNILIVLALLDAVGAGFFWYGYTQMADIKQHESDLRSQLAEEQQKGRKLDALRSTLASAAKDREQLERYLIDPSDENQIQLIAQIEQLGLKTSGVAVTTTSFDYLAASKVPTLHGEFTMNGTWKEMYHFLRLIEEFPTRITVNRYDIHSAPRTDSTSPNLDNWAGSISIDFAGLKQLQN